jgi:SPP1 family predicted phage head-tail adaptor
MRTAWKMDRKIAIQELVETQSGTGAPIWSFETVVEVWAEVDFQGGFEGPRGSGEQAAVSQIFRIRWRDGLTAKHAILFDGARYDIVAIREIGRRDGLELTAQASVE